MIKRLDPQLEKELEQIFTGDQWKQNYQIAWKFCYLKPNFKYENTYRFVLQDQIYHQQIGLLSENIINLKNEFYYLKLKQIANHLRALAYISQEDNRHTLIYDVEKQHLTFANLDNICFEWQFDQDLVLVSEYEIMLMINVALSFACFHLKAKDFKNLSYSYTFDRLTFRYDGKEIRVQAWNIDDEGRDQLLEFDQDTITKQDQWNRVDANKWNRFAYVFQDWLDDLNKRMRGT